MRRQTSRRTLRIDGRYLGLFLMLLSAAITLAFLWAIWVLVALAVTA